MSAASILAAAERDATSLGHSLGSWEHYVGFSSAACKTCREEAIVRWKLGTDEVRGTAGALTAHCRVGGAA